MIQAHNYPTLFSPIKVGPVTLKNRLVHASITTRFITNGTVSDSFAHYYLNRAMGEVAAIITEPMNMHTGQRDPRRLDIFNRAGLDSLKRLVEEVERSGCRIFGQVQDSGRGRHEQGRNDAAIGPSALPDDLSWTVPHALSTSEIERLIGDFATSCGFLKESGLAGVEISAGHGHLFHQFLSSWSNRREDDYGGDISGRTRIVRDLIKAIRAACGKEFAIGIKLPGEDGIPGSIDCDEAQRIASAVGDTGEIDYWTFCWGTHANNLYTHLPNAHGARAPYAAAIARLRQAAPDIVTAGLGYITDPNEAERLLTDGSADFVMIGRPLITDAAWGLKAREGRESEIRYCVSCNTCWRTIIEANRLECDNNPRVGVSDEADWHPVPVHKRKKIVVIGAGIAGMEAAWVAGARGHDVTVFGKSSDVGGKTRLHAALPGCENLSSIYDYQWLAAQRGKVKLELGVYADVDAVKQLEPDAIVLATGSRMTWPDFLPSQYRDEGFFPDLRELVATLMGRTESQRGKMVIFDKDHTEMTYDAAEYFSCLYDEVILVTPRERIAEDVSLVSRQAIYRRLYVQRVRIITSCEPCADSAFEEGALKIANIYNGDVIEISDIAAVTYATPRRPNDELLAPLLAEGLDVRVIGDCFAPRSVLAATREGHALGNQL